MIWDASDANPMHRRIPAEVVSRRKPQASRRGAEPTKKKEEEQEEVIIDLKAATSLKPESRPTWLRKACKMVHDGKGSSTELYNIVVSRKFAAGLPDRVARRLVETIKDSLDLFSDKQRRYLSSKDSPLMASQKREEEEAEAEVEAREKLRKEAGKLADNDEAKSDEDGKDGKDAKDAKEAAETADASAEVRQPEKPGDEPSSKTRVFIEQRAARTFDSLREERQRDRDAERARDRELDRERHRARNDASLAASASGGSKWQAAVDEAAQRRQVTEFHMTARKESAQKFGKHMSALEPEAAKKEDPAATKKKLEEEADDLLMNALLGGQQQQQQAPQPPPPQSGNGRPRERGQSRSISAKRKRSRSGSRSISSRTARRLARKSINKPKNDRADWRKSGPGDYLTGSRALLQGTYTEDLPHMPRPANAPPVGARFRVKDKSRSPTRFF